LPKDIGGKQQWQQQHSCGKADVTPMTIEPGGIHVLAFRGVVLDGRRSVTAGGSLTSAILLKIAA
jgi:hypothetical protein